MVPDVPNVLPVEPVGASAKPRSVMLPAVQEASIVTRQAPSMTTEFVAAMLLRVSAPWKSRTIAVALATKINSKSAPAPVASMQPWKMIGSALAISVIAPLMRQAVT